MDLASLLLDKLSFSEGIQNSGKGNKASADGAFDSVFESESKKRTELQGNDKSYERKTDNFKRQDKDTGRPKKVAARENLYKANRNDVKKKLLEDSVKGQDKGISETGRTGEEAVKDIAKALNVDESRVKEVLETLGITVEDLADRDNLMAFMQIMFGVEGPAELLSIDGFKDMLNTVGNIAKTVETAALAEDTVNVDIDEAMTASTANDTNTQAEKSDVQQATEETSTELTKLQGAEAGTEADSSGKPVNEAAVAEAAERNGADSSETNSISQENGGMPIQAAAVSSGMENTELNSGNSFGGDMNQGNLQNVMAQGTVQDTSFKAFTEAMSANESLRNLDTHNVIEQMIQNFKTNFNNKMTEIKITLKPEFLGDVNLKIVSENGTISAVFAAQNERVKEIIESNFDKLKDVLSEAGIEVSELSVSVGQDSAENNNQFGFAREQEKSQRRLRDIMEGITAEDQQQIFVEESEIAEASVNYKA